jgi:hypothetical protein
MQNEATIKLGDIELLVIYYYHPAIKGGLHEAAEPEHIEPVSAKMGDVDISRLIDILDGWDKVVDELRDQRRDSL